VGALEPGRRGALLDGLGFAADDPMRDDINDPRHHDAVRQRVAERFGTRTREHWLTVFGTVDACVTPVLSIDEAVEHPHHRARGTFRTGAGPTQPAPSPRFSGTPGGPSARATETLHELLISVDVSIAGETWGP
jgi:alpha-methylacyl-CoA racemase